MNKNDQLIVALDVSNLKEAKILVQTLSPVVKIFKIGKELFTACGPSVVEMVQASNAKVFLDLKFHDIPNTVAGACAAATRLKVFMLNVHASGGSKMMEAAAKSVDQVSAELGLAKPCLLGVTVLTSMNESDLIEVGVEKKVSDQVEHLARLAKKSALSGVVASPHEIELIRKVAGKDFVIVTPGVRPLWAASGDQKRVMTPSEAIQKGANFIVVGRPITQSKDPLAAAEKILEEIKTTS